MARRAALPRLIEPGSLRGDLQTQTTWTDGANSIEEMVAAAQQLGLEYMAITDHTRSLSMVGADETKIRLQMARIGAINKSLRGFRVLTGAEVNINKDGTLDIDDEVLAFVSRKREWVSRYEVCQALVGNPRTPVGISVRLVARLSVRELKLLRRDRNLPEPVRAAAARLYKIKSV